MSVISGVHDGRWRRRPGLARAYRIYVLAGPLLTLLGVVFFGSELLPTSDRAAVTVVRWIVIAAIALVSAVLAERTLSRLLPVAALLDLDLGFPGATPTRSRIASLASLRGGDAELMDLLPGVADRDLDAAAEHLMIRYASATRGGLRPRSHIDRVRALAAKLAERLDLTVGDIDRLQWALLMRDLGSISDDTHHPHQPLLSWLGPFAALVHGPYGDTAVSSASPEVRTAAHAAAVADAYVVVTAAHPYRRGRQPLPLDALTGEHLHPGALYALHAMSEQERRRAIGLTAGVSPLLARYSPRPQPVLTLASIVAVLVLVVGVGVGPSPESALPAQAVVVSQPPGPEPIEAADPAGATPSVAPSPRSVEATTETDDEPKDGPKDEPDDEPRAAAASGGSGTAGSGAIAARLPGETFTAQAYADTSTSRRSMSAGTTTSGAGGSTSSKPKSSSPKQSASPAPPKSSPSPTPAPSPRPTPPPPDPDPAPAPDPEPDPEPDPDPGPAPAPDPDPAPEPDPAPPPDTDPDPAPAPAPAPSP